MGKKTIRVRKYIRRRFGRREDVRKHMRSAPSK